MRASCITLSLCQVPASVLIISSTSWSISSIVFLYTFGFCLSRVTFFLVYSIRRSCCVLISPTATLAGVANKVNSSSASSSSSFFSNSATCFLRTSISALISSSFSFISSSLCLISSNSLSVASLIPSMS